MDLKDVKEQLKADFKEGFMDEVLKIVNENKKEC
jgi:hypothetical protein